MMFNRGSGSGDEYNRYDNTMYRGIVVDTSDPLRLNRVKIYIPEISNQPYDDWLEKIEDYVMKAPGQNIDDQSWEDIEIYESIIKLLPWAEPCFPLMGEASNFTYYKDGKVSTISDCDYPEGFEVINDELINITSGSFSPSYLFENYETCMGDHFNGNVVRVIPKMNPFSYQYRPSKHTNKGKGLFGIPNVGSKVWVFHYQGDLNFPIYFGAIQDLRTLHLINDTDNDLNFSATYPSAFES